MANKYLQQLKRYQKDIVKDLDVKYILGELFTKDAINSEEYDKITDITNRVDRAEYLIATLTHKIQGGNINAFVAFHETLAKDYYWLWELLSVESTDSMHNASFEDSLSKGDVPRPPKHCVRRLALEKEVSDKLKLLTRHNVLVLYGMLGSGKTTLAIRVLRQNPELIENNFGGVVFWLDMKDCKTVDDIVALQNNLFHKISLIVDTQKSIMTSSMSMSSVGSADSQILSIGDWTWRELRDKLKNQFTGNMIKDALLVLDDVNEAKCAEAFDVGCKMLITTRDASFVSSFNVQSVNISNTLTETESLQVFAMYLGVEVAQLPPKAKKLHKICKGSPFHVGLMGSQLAESRERLLDDPKHWSYFINMFNRKKDIIPFFSLSKNNDYNPKKTIEVFVNSLKPHILTLFKMLAIFPDNAHFTTEVLSKLWQMNTFEVSDIAQSLAKKSLITQSYIPEKTKYIYFIHDFIMDYLRQCLDKEEIKRLHSEFLNSYSYGNFNNLSMDIIDDGYLAHYIGFHILETKNLNNKWSLFPKLFLDLSFLGNKVRLTGPADVLMDLQKYENYIVTGDNLEMDFLNNVKTFLRAHGTDLFRYPKTEIVQSILQHECKGVLYNKAREIAKNNCKNNELVFEFLHEQNVEEVKHSTIDVKETITVVCFLGDCVLVGTSSGKVKCFHLVTNTLKLEVPISPTPIKWVGPCPINPPLVAALSYDGVVKIWYFEDLVDEDGIDDDVIDEEPEDLYDARDKNYMLKNVSGPFINCRWMNHSEALLTHTQHQIEIYTAKGEKLRFIDINDKEIISCIPCNADKYVVAACICMGKETDINTNTLEVFNILSKEKIAVFKETDTVMDLLAIKGSNRIITLKEKEIMQHEFTVSYPSNVCHVKEVLNTNIIRPSLSFLSMAVNKAGSYLFVSTNDSRVIGVDLKTVKNFIYLENRRGNVISMSVSEILSYDDFTPGSDVLVTGTDGIEKCAKVWYLDASIISNKHKNARLTTDFDTSFRSSTSPVTPINITSNGAPNISSIPKRHNSFTNTNDVENKKVLKGTKSLDRGFIKPLNLKGICNGNIEKGCQPFLTVVDDKNNIQIMRGRKILTEISCEPNENILIVRISPCNHFIFYGTSSGKVQKITLCNKEVSVVSDINSPVIYMEFVNANLLIASGRNGCTIAYRMVWEDNWQLRMISPGNTNLGSQELLDTIGGTKMNGHSDKISVSTQDSIGSLTEKSILISCFWMDGIGLITVESNATIKLWAQDLEVMDILQPRQVYVMINRATFRKNVLAICDNLNKGFQTFNVIKENNRLQVHPIETVKLMCSISSCDLTSDGNILALGLDNGDVVVWNVRIQRQLHLLKQHKSKVQWCSFSPVPSRLYRSNSIQSSGPVNDNNDYQPPLVLVTMASEVIWWNITYLLQNRSKMLRAGRVRDTGNVVSPIASPIAQDLPAIGNMTIEEDNNFFFGAGSMDSDYCWNTIWRNKTHKKGAKRKDILACIKLSGICAKRLYHDKEFSCFTTVDNAGQIHIMNVMREHIT